MTQYITRDKVRNEYIFQIRVPKEVQSFFDTKLIKQRLGDCNENEARTRALQYANHYKTLFSENKKMVNNQTKERHSVPSHKQLFNVDPDIMKRFVATWEKRECGKIKEQIRNLQTDDPEMLNKHIWTIKGEIKTAKEDLFFNNTDFFQSAVTTIETLHHIKLDGTEVLWSEFSQIFKDCRVTFLKRSLKVFQGEISVRRIEPETDDQLPLLELWGKPANELVENWRTKVSLQGDPINLKTDDKYCQIVYDFGEVLGRRPVQDVNQYDLVSLITRWKARNGPTTIRSKLRILKSLLKPFVTNEKIAIINSCIANNPTSNKVSRLHFTPMQLRTYYNHVDASSQHEDKMLLSLLLLTGARIGELSQLRCKDIEQSENFITLKIADARQTGSGTTRLKNFMSSRRLPVAKGVFPALDAWITDRSRSDGYLFTEMQIDKNGTRGAAAAKRLNCLLRQIAPDDKRLVLQSVRNTMAQVMRRAGVDPRVRYRFVGHADAGIHDKHYDPADSFDDHDLESGSLAIADFLIDTLRIKQRPSVRCLPERKPSTGQYCHDMPHEGLRPLPEKDVSLNLDEPEIDATTHGQFEVPPGLICFPERITFIGWNTPDFNVCALF